MRLALSISVLCVTAAAGQTWFAPNYRTRSADQAVHTPADFMRIFDDAAWPGRPPFQVFKVYAMFLKREPDAVLSTMFAWLRRDNLRLAVEFGMLTPEECGTGVEGFDGVKSAAFIAGRVSRLGGRIDMLAMDEPYWHTSHSPKPNACHWQATRTADNAASTARVFRGVFPNIEIGDIEPVADVPAPGLGVEFGSWADAFARASGHPLAFLHMDVLWDRPWRNGVREIGAAMSRRSIPVGAILSGDVRQSSDADWLDSLHRRRQALGPGQGVALSDVVLQSWSTYPDHIFPARDPTAFASVFSEVR